MEFVFETDYNQKAMTAMARTLRKTLRKKKSRRSHIFGIGFTLICLLIVIPFGDSYEFGMNKIVTSLVAAALIIVLIWEDRINGYTARKHMLSGMEKSTAIFTEDGYTSEVALGKSEWSYERMLLIAETKDYFVFVFSQNHAQIYDKSGLTGGTAEEFKEFIVRKTGKSVVEVK